MSEGKPLEADEQAAVIRWCKQRGLFVRKQEAPFNKGWPDLFIGNPRNGRHMMLEMKAVNGRESAHQKQTVKFLRDCGVHVVVTWGKEQAKSAVQTYLWTAPEFLGKFKA